MKKLREISDLLEEIEELVELLDEENEDWEAEYDEDCPTIH